MPFVGLEGIVPGGLRFGENRMKISARFAEEFGEQLGERHLFRKAPWQIGLCDHYVDGDLILHFDDHDRLFYAEVYDPAPILYRGVRLLGRPCEDVLADLRSLSCLLVEDDFGWEAPDAGFNLSVRDRADPSQPAYSVGVFLESPASSVIGMSDEPPVTPIREHQLVSLAGTDTIRLGQDRWELRERLGPALQTRPEYGAAVQDWYSDHGLVLGFDAADRLVTLVITYVDGAGTAWFRGVQLLGRPYLDVVENLATRGVWVDSDELGGRVQGHGFTLNLAGLQNPALPIVAAAFTH